jgi:protein TonB
MLAGMKFWRWLFCCFLICAPVAGQTAPTPPMGLRQLKGKIVFLRDMDASDELKFDAQGAELNKRIPGAFAYDAMKIEKVHESDAEVKIKGWRVELFLYVKPSSPSHRNMEYVLLNEEVRITIARDASHPEALEPALDRIFAFSPVEELRSMTPKEEVAALATLGTTAAQDAGGAGYRASHAPLEIASPGFGRIDKRDITPPRLIHSVEAGYSDEARRKKIGGTCILSLIVDTNGRPTHIRVVQSVDPGLGFESVKAVAQYRFIPAMYHGQAVAMWVNVEVNFRIY